MTSIALCAFLSLMAAIFIGSRLEAKEIGRAKGTLPLYANEQVCGISDDNIFTTFPSLDDAHANGQRVAHCGTCGGCSSVHDMTIYAATRNTLTNDAFVCGVQSFLGIKRTSKCFDKRIGFTRPCEKCWTNNIACTKSKCKWTCLKYKMLGQSNNDQADGSLNICLKW